MPSSQKRSTMNGTTTPHDLAAAAVNAAAEAEDVDIATAAVHVVPEAKKAAIAAAAVNAAPDENKADVATAAVDAVPDAKKADTLTTAIRNAPHRVHQQVADQLLPDQVMTNKIWFGIVVTFALVLGGTTLALVGAIFVGFWRKVDTANVQILLTVFSTSAGILAGFISGRASTSKGRG
jgi:hypothetical protein